MKKILLSLFVVMIALVGKAQVTFDFDNNYESYFNTKGVSSGSNDTYVADGEFNEDQVVTVDGVTITIKASAEDATTRNRVWASSPRLRMYNESFSVKAPGHKVTCIDITSSKYDMAVAVGTLAGTTWTGSEEEVVFTVNKNTQIKKIVVTLDQAVEPQPETHIENTPATAYTVAKANELITADKALNEKVYVAGTIVSVKEISLTYGNATYFISDDGTEQGQLQVFRGLSFNGEKFTDEAALKAGDKIVVYGQLTNYNGTYEVAQGSQIYSLNGKTSEGTTPETPDTTVVDAQHLSIADFLAKADTENAYELTGKVISIVNDTYGNLTIEENGSSIYIYGLLDKEGQSKNFASLGVAVGDVLTIVGTYSLYKDEPQIKNAQFVSVEKGEVPPYLAEGDGTKEHPYTVNDVKALCGTEACPADPVWVKGTIVGCASSGTNLAEEAAETNIAIGVGDCWIPVQLPTGAVREGLNLVKNPDNLGKEVCLLGKIETYFKVAGVKSVTEYVIAGQETAISSVAKSAKAAIFDLSGRRVNNAQNGIYIMNGKKVVK